MRTRAQQASGAAVATVKQRLADAAEGTAEDKLAAMALAYDKNLGQLISPEWKADIERLRKTQLRHYHEQETA
jgi:hypothetical protein